MRTGSGLFLLGVMTLMQFRELPATFPVVIITLGLCLIAAQTRCLRFFLWYFSGFLWAYTVSTSVLHQHLDPELETREIIIQGQVVSLPEPSDYSVQFNFQIEKFYVDNMLQSDGPQKVRLNWYAPYPDLVAGQILKLAVSLRRPHGFMNRNGFDYEAWLFQQRIRATGYVHRLIKDSSPTDTPFSFDLIRHMLQSRLVAAMNNSKYTGLILALAIGDQSGIEKKYWQVLTATGTGHLISISGLHIGLIATLVYFLVRWCWPVWSSASLILPAQRMASLMSLLAAIVYSGLAGFSLPVQRSLVMIAAFVLPSLTNRKITTADSFAMALLVILILDPLAVLSSSFWLSFGAVLVILAIPAVIQPIQKITAFNRWLIIQLYIFVGLTPVLAIWFYQFTPVSLLANGFAIPWISFLTVPLVLSGTVLLPIHEPLASILLLSAIRSLDMIWPLLEFLSVHSPILFSVPHASFLILIAALIGVVLLFLPPAMPARWLGLFWLLPLFFQQQAFPDEGYFDAEVLDVGQGLSVLIRTRNHVLLYDTGPGTSTGFNAGWAVIVPYLRSYGINKIDRIVLSHGDNDHIGGLQDVLQTVEVSSVLTSVPEKVNSDRVTKCQAGQRWVWDGVLFEILAPDRQDTFTGNDASCVLKVGKGRQSILIPGDVEKNAELSLLARNRIIPGSQILLAPHHGSMTSSTPGLVRAVAPDYVIISAGFLNRYRLPKQDIIDRYHQYGSIAINTAYAGAVSIQFDANGFWLETERDKSSRLWNFNTVQYANREE